MDNLHGLAALQGIAEIKSRVEVNSKHIKEKTIRKFGFGLCSHRYDFRSILQRVYKVL